MSSPDPPPYRPRLVDTEVVERGSTAEELWTERARNRNAGWRVAEIRRQVEATRQAEHDAYIAECERLGERYDAENALAAARWSQPYPAGPDVHPPAAPDPIRSVPDPVDDDGSDSLAATLDARAAALFRAFPEVSREKVQAILGCNTYRAKTLYDAARAAR